MNNSAEIKVNLPMFVSTTDDTPVFAFEGAVNGKDNDVFIVNIKIDTGTRSSYSKDTSSTDSCRGIRIRYSVSFNAVGNAAPFYTTVYGLTEEELPTTTCPSYLPCPSPVFATEVVKTVPIKQLVISYSYAIQVQMTTYQLISVTTFNTGTMFSYLGLNQPDNFIFAVRDGKEEMLSTMITYGLDGR